MQKKNILVPIFISLIFVLLLCAGCISDSGSSSPTPPVTGTTAPSGAQYSAGDVVKNPKTASTMALLVTGYDPTTQMYERALIYPNSDGTWGYRVNTNTEKIAKATLENVYTAKVTKVTVSAIPVRTPTPATTVPSQTTVTQRITTATTTAAPKPQIRGIDPESALAGTTVTISDLKGYNFQTNASLALARSGENTIAGASVTVVSSNKITGKFVIPLSATTGAWDILVTNPDGQFHRYQNGFTIRMNAVTSSTPAPTTTSSAGSATLTSVSPPVIVAGAAGTYQIITVTGSNIPTTANILLRQSGKLDMTARSGTNYKPSPTQLQASFDILPTPTSSGSWDLILIDSTGTTLATLPGALTIS
ncbi:MAG: hypothetical protein METHP_02168 [Methanoregula sp. SKADARSKE-2]|nr:MAG: hypothetical protein METHP_02168 [Methanoregula sp. SKADARSKE-2]